MQHRSALGVLGIGALISVWGCDCGDSGLVDARARLFYEPESVDFGKVTVGDQRIKSLAIQNKGQVNLGFTRFELSSGTTEIALGTPPLSVLMAAQKVDFNLVYEPTNVGEDTASIVIRADDDPDNERVITLRGEGVVGGVALTHDGPECANMPGSLSFGRVAPNQTAMRTVTITAAGSAPVSIFSAVLQPGASGEFAIDDVPATRVLQPGETLSIAARYTPADGGADSGAFVITTDAPDSPSIRIPVCGESVAPAICATPYPLNIGAVAQGGVISGVLELESCGLEPLDLSAVALSSDAAHPTSASFRISVPPNTPTTLAPGARVMVTIEFTANQLGVADGFVRADSNALNNTTAYFPITARGAQPCDLTVAPTMVTFSNVAPGGNQQKQVLLANNGATACTVNRLQITTGSTVFSVTSPTAPVMVPAGNSVLVNVQYAPTAAGAPDMGTLEVEEAGVITPVQLIGNPTTDDGCHLEVVPAFVNFGAVPPNTVRTMGVSLNNISQDPCVLQSVSMAAGSDPDFVETSPSLGFILPGRSKQLSVTYTPSQPGTATGTLHIETNALAPSDFDVPLFATSAESGIRVDPLHLAFGPRAGLATMSFTIYAIGVTPVQVTALDWTTPDAEFTISPAVPVPFTLAPGANRGITVNYLPADAVGDTGVITVRSDDLAQPAIPVTVTGGPETVPAAAGRYLYYWQIPNPISGGDVVRVPLQGLTTPQPWWGPRTGKACSGCHSVSPDGRYVAVIEAGSFKIVDTTTDIALSLPNGSAIPSYLSWRPNVATTPPYQYVYDDGQDLAVGALFDGVLYPLAGANDPNWMETMPSWGSNGMITFARGMVSAGGMGGQSFGLQGPVDVLVVPEAGGTSVPLSGASGGTSASYYPTFSPNGRWIAITHSPSAASTIAATDAVLKLVRSDNSGLVLQLTNANSAPGNGASSFPTWSVDGSFISFSSNRSGGAGDWDIYIAPIDPMTGADGPATNVTAANTAAFEHSAQWSP